MEKKRLGKKKNYKKIDSNVISLYDEIQPEEKETTTLIWYKKYLLLISNLNMLFKKFKLHKAYNFILAIASVAAIFVTLFNCNYEEFMKGGSLFEKTVSVSKFNFINTELQDQKINNVKLKYENEMIVKYFEEVATKDNLDTLYLIRASSSKINDTKKIATLKKITTADLKVKSRKFDDAEKIYLEIEANDPLTKIEELNIRIKRVLLSIAKNDYQKARDLLFDIKSLWIDNKVIIYFAASLCLHSGDYQVGFDLIKELEKNHWDSTTTYYEQSFLFHKLLLIKFLNALGRPGEANLQMTEKTLDIIRNSRIGKESIISEIYYEYMISNRDNGDYINLKKILHEYEKQKLNLNPLWQAKFLELKATFIFLSFDEREKSLKLALKIYKKLGLNASEESLSVLGALGKLYLNFSLNESAEESFTEANLVFSELQNISISSIPFLIDYAIYANSQKEFNTAIDAMNKAKSIADEVYIGNSTEFVKLDTIKAFILYSSGNYLDAKKTILHNFSLIEKRDRSIIYAANSMILGDIFVAGKKFRAASRYFESSFNTLLMQVGHKHPLFNHIAFDHLNSRISEMYYKGMKFEDVKGKAITTDFDDPIGNNLFWSIEKEDDFYKLNNRLTINSELNTMILWYGKIINFDYYQNNLNTEYFHRLNQ